MNRPLMFVSALGVGAGLEYAFDPDRGRRRRAIARDKLQHAARVAKDGFIIAARDGVNRSIGALAELRARVSETDPADDVLVERVRSRLGRTCRDPHAIHVAAENGCVTLEGGVHGDELARVVARVETVRGVHEVRNHLQVVASEGIEARERSSGVYAMRPSTRLLAIVAGTSCCLTAFTGKHVRPFLGGLGIFLVGRALTDPGLGKGTPLARRKAEATYSHN